MFPVAQNFLLSVVVRTQLKRPECLLEALNSLQDQTDQRFEVLLVLHSAEGLVDLQALVESLPQMLREKISVLQVHGGQRGVPLNIGIEARKGSHVSFFDDDDLVGRDWVAKFHEYAEQFPGKILRAQVATLWSKRTINENGNVSIEQLEAPISDYSPRFTHVDHLLVNHSPFMSMCFPATLFVDSSLRIDESLAVCEDWSLILAAANLEEVISIPEVTAYYRRWVGQETSYSIHSQHEWELSEQKVISGLANQVLRLPGSELYRIRELLTIEQQSHALRQAAAEKLEMENSLSWKITAPLRTIRRFFRE